MIQLEILSVVFFCVHPDVCKRVDINMYFFFFSRRSWNSRVIANKKLCFSCEIFNIHCLLSPKAFSRVLDHCYSFADDGDDALEVDLVQSVTQGW